MPFSPPSLVCPCSTTRRGSSRSSPRKTGHGLQQVQRTKSHHSKSKREVIWSLIIVELTLLTTCGNVSQFSFPAAYVLGEKRSMGDHPASALVVMVRCLPKNFQPKLKLKVRRRCQAIKGNTWRI